MTDQIAPDRRHNHPPEPLEPFEEERRLSPPVVSDFDYALLEEAIGRLVHDEAQAIKANLNQERRSRRDTGARLLRVKKELLDHGQFGDWIRLEFGMSHTTATRYMNVALRLTADEFCTVQNFNSATLYALAGKNTSRAFLDQLLDEIRRGDLIPSADRALNDRLIERIHQLKSGANPSPTKKSERAFDNEVWAKEAVKFMKQEFGIEKYRKWQELFRGTSPTKFSEVALAEKPDYSIGLVTGTAVKSNGLPLDDKDLVNFVLDRDTRSP